jgi:hypothetical protein
MQLKEKIENNIIRIVVVTSIVAASLTFSVVTYFKNNEIDRITSSDQQKFSQFNFVSSDTQHINISKLVIDKNDEIPNLNQLKYFSSDHFYAEKSNKDWSYFLTKDDELYKHISTISEIEFKTFAENEPLNEMDNDIFKEYEKKYPIHLWRNNTPIIIYCKNEKTKYYPYISIQRLDADAMMYLAENAVNYSKQQFKNLYGASHKGSEFDSAILDQMKIERYEKMKKEGFSQFLFYSKTFDYAQAMLDQGIDFDLSKVIKSGDEQYAKIIWKCPYCEENPELSFFMIEEFFILKLPDCIFSVNIKMPSYTPNPDNKIYSEIKDFIVKARFVK